MFNPYLSIYLLDIKRFYKNVNIIKTDSDSYEIVLDKRKLKTPKGKPFYVNNELLASMIAAEWEGQKEKIQLNQMQLTTLANTVIDNPSNLDKEAQAERLVHFLEGDTLCFRMPEPEELLKLQVTKWDPVVHWFANYFSCSVPVTQNVTLPEINEVTRNTLSKYFNSFNIWSLTGITFAAENLKSIMLTCAVINRQLSVEDAIHLSRIEENYQADKWGTVEYHHDLETYNLQTRVSAAVMFTLLNSEKSNISQKSV